MPPPITTYGLIFGTIEPWESQQMPLGPPQHPPLNKFSAIKSMCNTDTNTKQEHVSRQNRTRYQKYSPHTEKTGDTEPIEAGMVAWIAKMLFGEY